MNTRTTHLEPDAAADQQEFLRLGSAKQLFGTPLLAVASSARNVLLVSRPMLLSHALINHYGLRLVARLNDLSLAVQIVPAVPIVGALGWFAPKQPASFFFERVTHNPPNWP